MSEPLPSGRDVEPLPSGPAADPRAPYARVAVVGLIARADHRGGRPAWLLLHRVDLGDCWDPPGGRAEEGEDLVSAVVREVREETGLEVRVVGPCYALLTVHKGERLLAVSMACRLLSDPDAVRLEPEGAIGWRWASEEEWEELAAVGRSSWSARDVRRVAAMVAALWEVDDD